MPHNRIPKTLLFNEDKYKMRGRPFKSLLEQVLKNESLTLDRLCNNAMMKKNFWYCLHEIDMSFSEIVDSIYQQIDRVVTTVIEAHVQILLVIVICKLIYICRASVRVQQSCWNLLKERLIGCHRRQYAEQAVTTSLTSGKWISLVQFMFFFQVRVLFRVCQF